VRDTCKLVQSFKGIQNRNLLPTSWPGQVVKLLFYMQKVMGSHFSPETGCFDCDFYGFPELLQAVPRIVS
jgi:hypothetical protein